MTLSWLSVVQSLPQSSRMRLPDLQERLERLGSYEFVTQMNDYAIPVLLRNVLEDCDPQIVEQVLSIINQRSLVSCMFINM